ncbi:MAG: IS110 family transposase, partial [Actinobacteria bacterium]|nr:IS110 family transposase [Actinomycetota bacterium]
MGKSKKHIRGRKGEYFSEQIRGINLEQVLIVAIDAAKHHQKALICNYFGDVIEDSFFFATNLESNQLLVQKLNGAKERTNAVKVFIGIES